jgi:hypothetical protein
MKTKLQEFELLELVAFQKAYITALKNELKESKEKYLVQLSEDKLKKENSYKKLAAENQNLKSRIKELKCIDAAKLSKIQNETEISILYKRIRELQEIKGRLRSAFPE